MKQLYAIIFIIMTLVLGACVIITFASKKPIARYLRYPIIFALLPTIANFTLMICSTPAESNMAYSIFYGSINWLLLTLLRYWQAGPGDGGEDFLRERPPDPERLSRGCGDWSAAAEHST